MRLRLQDFKVVPGLKDELCERQSDAALDDKCPCQLTISNSHRSSAEVIGSFRQYVIVWFCIIGHESHRRNDNYRFNVWPSAQTLLTSDLLHMTGWLLTKLISGPFGWGCSVKNRNPKPKRSRPLHRLVCSGGARGGAKGVGTPRPGTPHNKN